MMKALNLSCPDTWAKLTQKQLLHVFTCIAAGYTPTEIQALALMRWNNIQVLEQRDPNTYHIKKDGIDYIIPASKIAELLPQLNFLTQIPEVPVRLEKIKGHQALPADFQEVPFEKFIMCDNLYQGYLHMQSSDILSQLACILYDTTDISLTKAQEVSIFYWWTTLKQYFSKQFPHFLKANPSPSGEKEGLSLYRQLNDSMNAQIRALTKGDITKEKEVLSLDTWRALTELDAQAHEYDDLQRKYPQK